MRLDLDHLAVLTSPEPVAAAVLDAMAIAQHRLA